jgi:hypothetical protein
MSDKDAGLWLRINTMLGERFHCRCAFDADDANNLLMLAVFIKSRATAAEEKGTKEERERWMTKREDRRIRRIANQCGLDAYDAEVRVREKRRMRQQHENLAAR